MKDRPKDSPIEKANQQVREVVAALPVRWGTRLTREMVEKLPQRAFDDLGERWGKGEEPLSEEGVKERLVGMELQEALGEYLAWNGIHGYAGMILGFVKPVLCAEPEE